MQIFILGMHRSGTSMLARLVNMMGAYFGPEKSSLEFNVDNPKGFWERKDVMAFNDELLKSAGCAWNNVSAWPDSAPDIENLPRLKRAIQSLILDLDAHRAWMVKDPRFCLTLPYWKPYLEVPVAVIIYRDPREIAQSLAMRNGMALSHGLALWEAYAVNLFNATRDMPRIFIRHAELLVDPLRSVARLHAELKSYDVQGLRMPSAREINAFVDAKLYRARVDKGEGISLLPGQLQLEQMMQGIVPISQTLFLSEEAQTTLRNSSL